VFQAEGRTNGPSAGQTDMTKLTVAIRNFANPPKNDLWQIVESKFLTQHCATEADGEMEV